MREASFVTLELLAISPCKSLFLSSYLFLLISSGFEWGFFLYTQIVSIIFSFQLYLICSATVWPKGDENIPGKTQTGTRYIRNTFKIALK